ncbi:FAD-dependent monooxygenase [Mycobacterium sp. MUNTM1]
MIDHDALIVGAGPTGLMLAGELALAGIDIAVIERRTHHDLAGSRAGGMTSRTLEILDQRGIVDRFLTQGWTGQIGHYAGIPLPIGDLPARHNYGLGLPQYRIERALAGWARELGANLRLGCEVTGFTQDDGGVDVALSDGATLRTQYLIGCDGGRSLIRKNAGIDFPGWDPSTSCLLADVEMGEDPPWGMHRAGGFHSFFKLEDDGPVRVMVAEPDVGKIGEPTLNDVREALITIRGTDYGIRSATWISRFTDVTRQASSYRDRRVLLAGDAAHVHFPIGGQGLNTGMQDAMNLGWKLAHVINGTSPEMLLDTYHTERHPVAANVLHNTMAQTALNGSGARIDALRDAVSELIALDGPRRRIAAMMCGLDIHYDLGHGHPQLGRRMPDIDVHTAAGPTRVCTLLHHGQAVLLNLRTPWSFDASPWAHTLSVIHAEYAGGWELPIIGNVTTPHAVLIRPDGYVAWVGNGTQTGLTTALTSWLGPPRPTSPANR